MSQSRKIILAIAAFVVAVLVASGTYIFSTNKVTKPEQGKADVVDSAPSLNKLPKELGDILAAYRKVIVLLGDEKSLSAKEKTAANRIGQALFHENLGRLVAVDEYLESLKKLKAPEREAAYDTILNFIESGDGLFDADRLAFREVLLKLQKAIATEQTLPAIKLHKRVGDDLAALDEIEREYDKELKDIFS